MEVRGGFGILDEGEMRGLLRRSLLWCRGPDSLTPKLSRIKFSADSVPVPSWSWMAYTGGKDYPGAIDYLDLEFDTWGLGGSAVSLVRLVTSADADVTFPAPV